MKLRPQTSRIFRAVSRRLHDAARHLEQPGTKTGRRLPEARLLALGKLDEALWLNQPWFQSLHIATVLDIGANTGQFSAMIRIVLPRAYIHAFEPLPDCYDRLKKRMAGDARFTAHNLALKGGINR